MIVHDNYNCVVARVTARNKNRPRPTWRRLLKIIRIPKILVGLTSQALQAKITSQSGLWPRSPPSPSSPSTTSPQPLQNLTLPLIPKSYVELIEDTHSMDQNQFKIHILTFFWMFVIKIRSMGIDIGKSARTHLC